MEDRFFFNIVPRQSCTAGSGRKASEITGIRKQYSGRKHFGFFPLISDLFLLEPTEFSLEFIGKNPSIFLSKYCFRIPVISNVFLQDLSIFPASFLQDQVGSADQNRHLGLILRL